LLINAWRDGAVAEHLAQQVRRASLHGLPRKVDGSSGLTALRGGSGSSDAMACAFAGAPCPALRRH
jgi:hypothetical protein